MQMKLKYCILHFIIYCTCGLGYSNEKLQNHKMQKLAHANGTPPKTNLVVFA